MPSRSRSRTRSRSPRPSPKRSSPRPLSPRHLHNVPAMAATPEPFRLEASGKGPRTPVIHSREGRSVHATLHDLYYWTEHAFTHLGWMVLAFTHGERGKAMGYLKNLDRLAEQIAAKKQVVQDPDSKADLDILLMKVQVLQKSAKRLFS